MLDGGALELEIAILQSLFVGTGGDQVQRCCLFFPSPGTARQREPAGLGSGSAESASDPVDAAIPPDT
jgi:hypothetical protein